MKRKLVNTEETEAVPFAVSSELGCAVDAWRTWLRDERHNSDHTVEAYRRDLVAFLDYLAGQSDHGAGLPDLAALRLNDFKTYCDYRLAQGRAPSSVTRAVAAVKNFFGFLGSTGLVVRPAISGVAVPRVVRVKVSSLSQEQALKAVEMIAELSDEPWIAKRDAALVALLYGCGLRLGEALALKRRQAPQSNAQLTVGRNRHQRTVEVKPAVATAIEDYLRVCPYQLIDEQPLFIGVRGGALNPGVVQRQLRRLRGLLDLPVKTTPQALRRCFALSRLRTPGDPREL